MKGNALPFALLTVFGIFFSACSSSSRGTYTPPTSLDSGMQTMSGNPEAATSAYTILRFTDFVPTALNNHGVLGGVYIKSPGTWYNGKLTRYPIGSTGCTNGYVSAINDFNTAIGVSDCGTTRYTPSGTTSLFACSSQSIYLCLIPTGINNNDDAVFFKLNFATPNSPQFWTSFEWISGKNYKRISGPVRAGPVLSLFVEGINNKRVFVGTSRDEMCGLNKGFYGSDATAAATTVSELNAINDAGMAVGALYSNPSSACGGFYPRFAYEYSTVTHQRKYLGALYNYASPANSDALAINAVNQIVGYSAVSGGKTHAFLYENGTMRDLNTLLGDSRWLLTKAFAINNEGEILGSGTFLGRTARFLLVPHGVIP